MSFTQILIVILCLFWAMGMGCAWFEMRGIPSRWRRTVFIVLWPLVLLWAMLC